MKIFIDTNIICQNYYLDSASYIKFFKSVGYIPGKINIPMIVFLETVNRYKEDLVEQKHKYEKIVYSIKNMVKELEISNVDVESAVNNYQLFLTKNIEENNIEINKIPKVNHEKIIKRDLERKKPFKKNV